MMRKKLQSKKGFTLAELLIVVAIIAILVAILIPVFGASRAEATLARDAANLRSAYSEAVVKAMSVDGAAYIDVTEGSDTVSKLKVDLGATAGTMQFSKDTTATFKKAEESTKTPRCIEVKTKGAKTVEIIKIDDDVALTNGEANITEGSTLISSSDGSFTVTAAGATS